MLAAVVYCYALNSDDESFQRRHIEATVEHFKDVSNMTISDVAQLVHADGIHILVNLDGYTKNSKNEVIYVQYALIYNFL